MTFVCDQAIAINAIKRSKCIYIRSYVNTFREGIVLCGQTIVVVIYYYNSSVICASFMLSIINSISLSDGGYNNNRMGVLRCNEANTEQI